jgi:hypothetical protein
MKRKSNRRSIGEQKDFSSIGDILERFRTDEDKYISHEFQKYGYELAKGLGDLKNKSLYMKLAKETPRGMLETAKNFVKDAVNVRNRAALFLWKLTELKKLKTQKSKFKTKTKNLKQ